MTLLQAFDAFGQDLAMSLKIRGADDQAMDEISAALQRARERAEKIPKPTGEERREARDRALAAGQIRLQSGVNN